MHFLQHCSAVIRKWLDGAMLTEKRQQVQSGCAGRRQKKNKVGPVREQTRTCSDVIERANEAAISSLESGVWLNGDV